VFDGFVTREKIARYGIEGNSNAVKSLMLPLLLLRYEHKHLSLILACSLAVLLLTARTIVL
jgi:hypothetical protein